MATDAKEQEGRNEMADRQAPQGDRRRLPGRFQPVIIRATTPIDDSWREMGVEFMLPSGELASFRLDVEQARSLFRCLGRELGAHQKRTGRYRNLPQADYTSDDYPREGCKALINFESGTYSWTVYPPWVELVASGAPVESYFSSDIGSLGIALDAFARGGARSVETKKEMERAERAYAEASGSTVTE